ncbi:F-box domain-containing protein [Mycena chlorophos]|uniref:F-box domain-containing protein n=1 Tax=Mycena chlorophos TaxID=658473 RepID=A0A8H6W1C3_MYCCL|nr:F-box domain-containing protein [Mycena chlorophos]
MTQTIASSLRLSIAQADADIDSLKTQLSQRLADKGDLEAKLAAVVYPVLTLPAELTAEIMLCTAAVSQSRFPVIVASVCAQWRRIALATPRLWTRFSQAWPETNFADSFGALERWVQRSGTLPLDITLDLPLRESYKFWTLLIANIARWHRIDVSYPFAFLDLRYKHSWSAMAIAPSLSLAFDDNPSGLPELGHVDASVVPKWRSVFIGAMPTLTRQRSLDPTLLQSFRHVTMLALEQIPDSLFVSILQHTPELEYLRINGESDADDNAPVVPMAFPGVRTLNCSGHTYLRYLTLPGLIHLVLDGHWHDLPSSAELERFFRRSRCTLHDCLSSRFLDTVQAFNSVPEFLGSIGSLEDDLPDDEDQPVGISRAIRIRALLGEFYEGNILLDVVSLTLRAVPADTDAYLDVCDAVLLRARSEGMKLRNVLLELPEGTQLPVRFREDLMGLGVTLRITRHTYDY